MNAVEEFDATLSSFMQRRWRTQRKKAVDKSSNNTSKNSASNV
jgi:hypothetical protein